jgi:glyoxalase family protein
VLLKKDPGEAAPQGASPGFHHVHFRVREPERSRLFYGDLLGLPPLSAPAGPAGTPERLLFGTRGGSGPEPDALEEVGPQGVVLLESLPQIPRGMWGVGGVHHVALGTEDLAALLRWKRRLTDAGVAVTGPYDRGYFQSLYFADPDGHILELATAGPGYAMDESPDQLGERLMLPPEHRIRGHRNEEAIASMTHPEPVPVVDPEMALKGIHHITGITDNLESAHALFTQVLGHRLVKQTVNQDDGKTLHHFWARYDGIRVASGSAYTLFGWPGSTYRARHGVGQTARVGWHRGALSLEDWAQTFAAKGIPTQWADDPFPALHFSFPDGLPGAIV